MKLLPNTFTQGGFDFKVIKRDGQVAMLEKSKNGYHNSMFEVVIIQKHKAKVLFGNTLEDREAMPPDEAWGQFGWTPESRERAEAIYADLVAHQNA